MPSSIPDASLMLGGPEDGKLIALPGLLNPFLLPRMRPVWDLMLDIDEEHSRYAFLPDFTTHHYELEGVYKVYRYKGVW